MKTSINSIFSTFPILILLLCTPMISLAGELDGKGIICQAKGKQTHGFYFYKGNVKMFWFKGGNSKLELVGGGLGGYKTDELSVRWKGAVGRYSLDRKTLQLDTQFGHELYCKVAGDYNKFLEMMDPKLYTEENKI